MIPSPSRAQKPAGGRFRVLLHPQDKRGLKLRTPQIDPVAVPAVLVAATPHFRIYCATVLGHPGERVGQTVLKSCERDYESLAGFFGQSKVLQFNIILAPLSQALDGKGGAYHHHCGATDLYCDVHITPEINADVTSALVVAQAAEVFAAEQGGGWSCGSSNGEGLSRVLASELYPNVLEERGYATAPIWLNSNRPNFVRRTHPTDKNPVAIGCSVLFLNYLHSQLGYGWNKICQAAAPNLSDTFHKLTGNTAPFPEFSKQLEKKFPKGDPVDLTTDNPYPIDDTIDAEDKADDDISNSRTAAPESGKA